MTSYNEKRKEYVLKYLKKLKEIRFRVQPEEYEEIQAAAEAAGYTSLRQFLLDAIKEKMEKLKEM